MASKMKPLLKKKQVVTLVSEGAPNVSKETKRLIDEANKHIGLAKDRILAAYKHATNIDKLSPQQAKILLFRNLNYTPGYIRKVLPAEARENTGAWGKNNWQTQQRLIRENEFLNSNIPDDTKGKDNILISREEQILSLYIPANKAEVFAKKIQELLPTAKKTGYKINSDSTVEVKAIESPVSS